MIELIVGMSIVFTVSLFFMKYVPFVVKKYVNATVYFQNLVQVNNIQHIVSRDIENAEVVTIKDNGFEAVNDGQTYKYYVMTGYLIREKNNKQKLNSKKLLVDSFSADLTENNVNLKYIFIMDKSEKKYEIVDSVRFWENE
jgi:hypothetical protein